MPVAASGHVSRQPQPQLFQRMLFLQISSNFLEIVETVEECKQGALL
jgi:hypothetical protein